MVLGRAERGHGTEPTVKRAALAALAILYWVVVGHGHTPYFAALVLAAIRNDHRHAHQH